MNALLALGEAIQARVIDLHAEMVTRVLDRLEASLDKAALLPCSYARHLSTYVWSKIASCHCADDMEGKASLSPAWLELNQRWFHLLDRMDDAHRRMYDSPCKTCDMCLTRRKQWPTLPVNAHRAA